MPVTPTYPGLYIQEIPSGVRTIAAVATSVTAFIGRSLRGPVNEPIMCNNYGDFERIFGGLWSESSMSYAVRDFYSNGGSQALIVRLFSPVFTDDTARQTAFDAAELLAEPAATAVLGAADTVKAQGSVKMIADASVAATAASTSTAATAAASYVVNMLKEEASKSPTRSDAQAAIQVAVDAAKKTPLAIKTGVEKMLTDMSATASNASFNTVVGKATDVATAETDVDAKTVLDAIVERLKVLDPKDRATAIAGMTAERDAEVPKQDAIITAADAVMQAVATDAAEPEGTLATMAAAASTEIAKQNANNTAVAPSMALISSSVTSGTAPPPPGSAIMTAVQARKQEAIYAGADTAAPRGKAVFSVGGVQLQAKYEGSWGNSLRARVTTVTEDELDTKAFNLYVQDGATGRLESFLGVSTDSQSPRYVVEVVKTESKLVEVLTPVPFEPAASEPQADGGVIADRYAWLDANSSGVEAAGEASDGLRLQQADYNGDETKKTGLYALEKVELFNLLCIPPYDLVTELDLDLVTKAIGYCQQRRAFMIVDPRFGWVDKDSAKNGINEPAFPKSDYAAVFFPRLKMRDTSRGNRLADFVPCGAIAGLFARTDTSRGTWKAPAGLDATVNGVSALAVNLSDPEQGELNPLGVNCLRSFPTGFTNWGARTLKGSDRFASEYKYIPVRRMALLIENSLFFGLKWVVFEPNDEPLWSQIRLNVGAFMHGLFRQGAFEGTSPKDAYFVKCDATTTTSTDRNLGIVNILVGFAPLKPAEFVIISLQQMARKEN